MQGTADIFRLSGSDTNTRAQTSSFCLHTCITNTTVEAPGFKQVDLKCVEYLQQIEAPSFKATEEINSQVIGVVLINHKTRT